MSIQKAEQIISDDEDYDDDGSLKEEVKEDLGDKYTDLDEIPSDYSE